VWRLCENLSTFLPAGLDKVAFDRKKRAVVDNRLELLEGIFSMSKVITPHFEELIDRFVATGRFNNKSEVIRAGLRLLEEHEAKAPAPSREDLGRVIQTAFLDPRPLIPASKLLRRRQRR
jgi:antitoxin ParD1/3/4